MAAAGILRSSKLSPVKSVATGKSLPSSVELLETMKLANCTIFMNTVDSLSVEDFNDISRINNFNNRKFTHFVGNLQKRERKTFGLALCSHETIASLEFGLKPLY